MVFYRLGTGFICGLAIPYMVNDLVYMTISNSFLRPHLKYRIDKEGLSKDHAVNLNMLDSYIKDVIGSFLLFWIAIGPVVYESCIKKNQAVEEAKKAPKRDEIGNIEDDKYLQMLK